MRFQPTQYKEDEIITILDNCIKDVKRWMAQKMLQLNTDKTKYIANYQLQKLQRIQNAAARIILRK